jgi:hypothetical protein
LSTLGFTVRDDQGLWKDSGDLYEVSGPSDVRWGEMFRAFRDYEAD